MRGCGLEMGKLPCDRIIYHLVAGSQRLELRRYSHGA